MIPNFSLAGSILSRNHDLATFVHERLEWSLVDQSRDQSETECLCVDVAGYKTVNVYKAPRSRLTPTTDVPTPQSVRWRLQLPACELELQHNIPGRWEPGLLGNIQQPWTLYNPKETASFFSRRWNVGTNPDLAFASFGQESRLPDRHVLGKFPRSQHRPSLITPPRSKVPAHSDPVKRWNFRKVEWKRYCLLTGESAERLPSPDTPDIERAH